MPAAGEPVTEGFPEELGKGDVLELAEGLGESEDSGLFVLAPRILAHIATITTTMATIHQKVLFIFEIYSPRMLISEEGSR